MFVLLTSVLFCLWKILSLSLSVLYYVCVSDQLSAWLFVFLSDRVWQDHSAFLVRLCAASNFRSHASLFIILSTWRLNQFLLQYPLSSEAGWDKPPKWNASSQHFSNNKHKNNTKVVCPCPLTTYNRDGCCSQCVVWRIIRFKTQMTIWTICLHVHTIWFF